MPAAPRRDWRWKIEVCASSYPTEEWVAVRGTNGRLCRYVERYEADDAMAALKKIQPHAMLRIVPA